MRVLLLASVALMAGCAATYTEPPLPAEHPAGVSGAPAPEPARSATLDINEHPAGSGTPGGNDGAGAQGANEHGAAPVPAGGAGGEDAQGVVYACPMHPEVTSTRAGERCPKCGMLLKRRDGEER